jgi:hypothetical protein
VIPRRGEGGFADNLRLACLAILTILYLFALPAAQGQEAEAALAAEAPMLANAPDATGAGVMRTPAPKKPVEQEISVMGMIPDGDYRLISTTIRCDAWTVGVEYDRHSWGYLFRAQWDYVAEVIPFVLLSEPAKADFWGNPESPYQQHLYGVTVVPFGFRMLWRGNRPLKFYLSSKVGAIVFNQKALSLNASYANINVQAAFGVQYRLSDRIDLRVEPFTFFHISNGYLAASNPGMDELASRYGISYHLGRRSEPR